MNSTPHGVKYNNRYRGPQESLKTNSTYNQAVYNINKLKKKLEYLEQKKNDIIEKPKGVNEMISSVGILLQNIDSTIEKIINNERMYMDE